MDNSNPTGSEQLTAAIPLTRKDFVSDQEVRWCPGCGDYSILAVTQKMLPSLGVPKEKSVFISGIGCSSRFPYYVNTYGFHTIHGRAPAIATGVKVQNPDLQVWVITGDGDGLSIGGNHLIHALRRNVDLKIILFNNKIYGLTKGQYSPTSEMGKVTKSTPAGSIDYPISPISLAIGAEATFVARAIDTNPAMMSEVLTAAARHKGSAFVEIYQNCIIFNDDAFKDVYDKSVRIEHSVMLKNGQPIRFGVDGKKGIRMNGIQLEVVEIGKNGITENDLIVHNDSLPNSAYAYLLSRMNVPEFPVPFGVFRRIEKPTYEEMMDQQLKDSVSKKGDGDLEALLNAGDTWIVG